jgi:hypothetical protein
VNMDPVANQIFARIREGKPLGTLGETLPGTAPSEANIAVPVVNHAAGAKADGVERILTDGGFDITPGIVDYATFGAPIKGSVIAYKPGHLADAQVVQKYFPNLSLVEAPNGALRGSPVAIFLTASYQPQPVGGGTTTPTCITPGG